MRLDFLFSKEVTESCLSLPTRHRLMRGNDTAGANEEVAAATDNAVDRGRERRPVVIIDHDRPARAVVLDEAEMNHIAAVAWTL